MCEQTISPPIKHSKQCKQTKGRRCVYLCPAHGWAVQMQLFIYNPPNVPVIAFLVSVWFNCCGEMTASFPGRQDERGSVWERPAGHNVREEEEGQEWGEREWRERSWPQTQHTSAHQAGQRPKASTAGTV